MLKDKARKAMVDSIRNSHMKKSHRCKGSLEARKPVRYAQYPSWVDGKYAWALYSVETDFDWQSTYLVPVAKIRYCPFCGIELQKVSDDDGENTRSNQ